jgi:hypothetical protein
VHLLLMMPVVAQKADTEELHDLSSEVWIFR